MNYVLESDRKTLGFIASSKNDLEVCQSKLEIKSKNQVGYQVFVNEIAEIINELCKFIKMCQTFNARVSTTEASEVQLFFWYSKECESNTFTNHSLKQESHSS